MASCSLLKSVPSKKGFQVTAQVDPEGAEWLEGSTDAQLTLETEQ